jgi:hypothetical protein
MATPAKKPRVFEHPGRVAVIVIALVAVVNLAFFLGRESDTSETGPGGLPPLPSAIESIDPERGELTGPVDSIEVDLNDSYTGDLAVDGVTIPEDQIERTEQLGTLVFRPGPGKELTRLRTGENTVVVTYWPRIRDRPDDPPTFSWRFRVAA